MIDAAPLNVMDELPAAGWDRGESPSLTPLPHHSRATPCVRETHALCPSMEEQRHIQFKPYQYCTAEEVFC